MPCQDDNVAEVADGADRAQQNGNVHVDGPIELVDFEEPRVDHAVRGQLDDHRLTFVRRIHRAILRPVGSELEVDVKWQLGLQNVTLEKAQCATRLMLHTIVERTSAIIHGNSG